MLIFGTLPKICVAAGMTSYLYERKVRIFDYRRFAEPFRDELRENAERLSEVLSMVPFSFRLALGVPIWLNKM